MKRSTDGEGLEGARRETCTARSSIHPGPFSVRNSPSFEPSSLHTHGVGVEEWVDVWVVVVCGYFRILKGPPFLHW